MTHDIRASIRNDIYDILVCPDHFACHKSDNCAVTSHMGCPHIVISRRVDYNTSICDIDNSPRYHIIFGNNISWGVTRNAVYMEIDSFSYEDPGLMGKLSESLGICGARLDI